VINLQHDSLTDNMHKYVAHITYRKRNATRIVATFAISRGQMKVARHLIYLHLRFYDSY